jgi:2,5-diamino-6-(ribosylamino)-4(3H)-pyrimidinone 5'-phosphate reductase
MRLQSLGRPETTLFLLISVDGKISTGDVDARDVDKDYPKIKGVREGLYQYYDIERRTDLHSLNTGRVMAKIGVNNRKTMPKKIPVSFIIIDSKPHLNKSGILYLTRWVKTLYLVTSNKRHPAFGMKEKNLKIIYYPRNIDLKDLLVKLKKKYRVNRVTIQSGGTLNAAFLREKLIDHLSIVVAPALVGGKDTSTLIDGKSLRSDKDLKYIRALKLKKCSVLKNSYIHLQYDVINR